MVNGKRRDVTEKMSSDRSREPCEHLSGDAAILVEIVQVEGPVEFISNGASQDDGQTDDKVLQQGEEHAQ